MELRIYLVQMVSELGNVSANFKRLNALIEKANPEPGSLILLPELFSTGYVPQKPETFANVGESKILSAFAQKTKCVILGGGIEERKGKLFNHSGVYFPRLKNEKFGYDKTYLFFPEQKNFTAGNSLTLFKYHSFNIAMSICFDLRFPELYRNYKNAGAHLFTVQAAWPNIRNEHFEVLLKARAIENQCYIAAVNAISKDKTCMGNSQIISPQGEVLVCAKNKECVVDATISLNTLKKYRKEFPLPICNEELFFAKK